MQEIEIGNADRRAWTVFAKAVLVCYQKPEIAVQRMARYNVAKGQDALLLKLAAEPAFFGLQNGSLARGKRAELSARKDVQLARALLPLLAKAAFDVDSDLAALVSEQSPRVVGASVRPERRRPAAIGRNGAESVDGSAVRNAVSSLS